MALIRELPFSKYEIDMRFHTQVSWDIKKGSVGGSLWYAMVPRTDPLSQSGCTCHPCAVLAVNIPKPSLLWTITCCLKEPTPPSPTAAEVQKASLQAQGLCSGFTSQRALPQSWIRPHPCSWPAPSYCVLFWFTVRAFL